jgi:hypothetical protein
MRWTQQSFARDLFALHAISAGAVIGLQTGAPGSRREDAERDQSANKWHCSFVSLKFTHDDYYYLNWLSALETCGKKGCFRTALLMTISS